LSLDNDSTQWQNTMTTMRNNARRSATSMYIAHRWYTTTMRDNNDARWVRRRHKMRSHRVRFNAHGRSQMYPLF